MTDAVTRRDKEAAWQEIETRFSAQSGSFRNWHQLKNCWENLKKKSRSYCAAQAADSHLAAGKPDVGFFSSLVYYF